VRRIFPSSQNHAKEKLQNQRIYTLLDVCGGNGLNISNRILRGPSREGGVLIITDLGVKNGKGFRSLIRVIYDLVSRSDVR